MRSPLSRLARTIGAALLFLHLGCGSEIVSAGPDAIILGCNELLLDEVGVRELEGDVGDTVDVPVTVRGSEPIDSFGLELLFPDSVLEFVSVRAGNLTEGWFTVIGRSNRPGSVTIGGFHTDPIPANTYGQLALVRFRVIDSSTSGLAFATSAFTGDIETYGSCNDAHSPTAVSPASWGQIKANYAGAASTGWSSE